MTSYARTQQYKGITSQRLLRLAVGVLICMIFAYVYTLLSTTMLVAQKRSLESRIEQLHSEISQKEMSYLALSDVLTDEELSQYGFHEAKDVYFISRASSHADAIALATTPVRSNRSFR